MAIVITIDRLGRVVVPQGVRRRLGLVPGSRLRLRETQERIVLEPDRNDVELREEDGILVLSSVEVEPVDHRALREDRLARLSGRR